MNDTTLDTPRGLIETAAAAVAAARLYVSRAQLAVRESVFTDSRMSPDSRVSPDRLEDAQRSVHGLAWSATIVEGLAQLTEWAARLAERQRLSEGDRLIVRIGMGEYLAQILGG